jgi:ATP-dependent Clp protease protease subunit
MKKFYQLTQNDNVAELYIYGDITSYKWLEECVTAKSIIDEINSISADVINVYISSYGGEVQAGLAIYNALKRHKAKVRTICDGFACSIASVIFMAGEERIMNDSSLLMIHNAWSFAEGNAKELKKIAEDLEKITQASVSAYKAHSNLSEEEIVEMMDNETWILPNEAVEYGFATAIEKTKQKNASQNARLSLFNIVKMAQQAEDEDEEEETDEDEETPPDEENPVEAEETPDDETEDEESEEEEVTDDESEDETEEDDEDKTKEAAQRMSGFFNAFLKIERRN